MKRIAWKMPNGKVAFTTPAESMLKGETEDAYLDRIAEKTMDKQGWWDWERLPNVDPEIQADRKNRDSLKAE